jgi:putative heme-binding domain-containing protein
MKGGLLVSLEPAEVEEVRQLVQKKGSAQRGRALYLEAKNLACIRCHRLESTGGSIGPDLTKIWETHTLEKIMETLIDPSKEIKEGFQTYVAVTKKGLVYTGLKIAQNKEEVVLRDAEGRDIRIAAGDLDELAPSKQSLMPDNVIAQLTFDQFIDLVAFLKDRPAQESLQGMALEFWVVGPFPADLQAENPPEKQPDHLATYPGSNPGEKLTWQPRQADGNGVLNLQPVAGQAPATAYALTYVYSPQPQKVKMLTGGGSPFRVWVNGRLSEQNEVELKAGWNPLLAKVASQGGRAAFSLRFTGGQGIRVS